MRLGTPLPGLGSAEGRAAASSPESGGRSGSLLNFQVFLWWHRKRSLAPPSAVLTPHGRQKRRSEHAAAQYLPRRTILGIVRHSANLHSAAEPARTTDAANAATATGNNAVLNTRSHDTYLPRRTM